MFILFFKTLSRLGAELCSNFARDRVPWTWDLSEAFIHTSQLDVTQKNTHTLQCSN
jgi:hypothetical protein